MVEISDEYLNELFRNTNFGADVDSSIEGKKSILCKCLRSQMEGMWSGHTIYHIAINGGFLIDAGSGKVKKLTLMGRLFLEMVEGE